MGKDDESPGAGSEHPGLPEIDGPRLTPQGRDAPDGEDATDPSGGAKSGQPSKAEG